jgi:hypothetical protein
MSKIRNFVLIALNIVILVTLTISVALAGNTFVIANLRVDLPEIYNARDYKVMIATGLQPTTGDLRDFATGWFGAFLGNYDGSPFSGQFSQVGIESSRSGIRWFVYAEPGVICIRGTQPPNDTKHCYGDYSDLVGLATWHWMRLQKYSTENFWRAYVYDSNGIGYLVAKIQSDSNRIYMARSDTEEGYYESNDPYIALNFYHWHPQYMYNSVWRDWPESTGGLGDSEIWIAGRDNSGNSVDPTTICPAHYGTNPNFAGDERSWYAGSTGQLCSWLLFPSQHIFLPIVTR